MRLCRSLLPLLFALAVIAAPGAASAQGGVSISVGIAPPLLPVYAQPPIPGPGYLWMPGYWAWGSYGYYWVPGTWVVPPAPALLWTPGYWAWGGAAYVWHGGYWGPRVGYYGGVHYGFGYNGSGYDGGYWEHGAFHYNRAYNNIHNPAITTTYNKPVPGGAKANRASYYGGKGGTSARPPQEQGLGEQHAPPTSLQTQHEQAAAANRALLATQNHGRPPVAGTSRPGQFSGQGVVVVPAKGAKSPGNAPRPQAPQQHGGGPPPGQQGQAQHGGKGPPPGEHQ